MTQITIEKEFYENGQVKEEIPVDENDLIQGIVRSFNEDGSLDTEVPFENSVITGLVKWYQDGKLYATAEHVNNQKEGLLTMYKGDMILEEVSYHNNLRNGIARYYDENDGKLHYEITFEAGKAISGKEHAQDGSSADLTTEELLDFED